MNPLFMQWLMNRQQGQKPVQQGLAGLMQGDVGLGRTQGQMLNPTNPGMAGMMTPGSIGQSGMFSPPQPPLPMAGGGHDARTVLDMGTRPRMVGGGFTGGRDNPRRMMTPPRMGMK